MDETRKQYARKKLAEMNLIDDFLFTEIMSDEKDGAAVCSMILSCVLKREVKSIKFEAQKVIHGVSEQSHGIRLDVYVTGKPGADGDSEEDYSVYDVEVDNRPGNKGGIPKRSRYYGSLIDAKFLEPRKGYTELPDIFTIFILSYDPFDQNALYYEAGTHLLTHPDVPYDDGIRRIYLYTKGELPGNAGEDDRKLRNLLRYINESTEANVIDDNTRRLDEIVRVTKTKGTVEDDIVYNWERDEELKEEARAEERVNTERERKRADDAEKRADDEKKRADGAVNELNAAKERIAELEAALAGKK